MQKIFNKLKEKFFLRWSTLHSDYKDDNNFTKTNPLGGKGERVDITYSNQINYDALDIYQKSHFRRYEFATGLLNEGAICGDFACGTGYGSVMLADKSAKVIGVDISREVVNIIKKRYQQIKNVEFYTKNLLELNYSNVFDIIISFETIEHFAEDDIIRLFIIYNKALKSNGKIIFSTPYMQERTEIAINMGFHLTFYIDEEKIENWLNQTGYSVISYKYQNYNNHGLLDRLDKKDFIICIAQKN